MYREQYTPDGEEDGVIKVFTFSDDHVSRAIKATTFCLYPLPPAVEYGSDNHLLRVKLYGAHKAATCFRSQAEWEEMRTKGLLPPDPHGAGISLRVLESLPACSWEVPRQFNPTLTIFPLTDLQMKRDKGKGKASKEERDRWAAMRLNLENRLKENWIPNRSPDGGDHSGWVSKEEEMAKAWMTADEQDATLYDIMWGDDVKEGDGDPSMIDLTCQEDFIPPSSSSSSSSTTPTVIIDVSSEDEGVGAQTLEDQMAEEEEQMWPDLELDQLRGRLRLARSRKYRAQSSLLSSKEAVRRQEEFIRTNSGRSHWNWARGCEAEDKLTRLKAVAETRKRTYQEACCTADGLEFVIGCERERQRLRLDPDVERE